jgi:hypothetical protein
MGEKFNRKIKGKLGHRKTSVNNRTGGAARQLEQLRKVAKRQTNKTHDTKKVVPGTGQR